MADGVASINVTATTAGASGNAQQATKLTLVSPVGGIDSGAAVAAGGLTGGADIETDEALRKRVLARIRQAPHGGAYHDYVRWAYEASPAVRRVWVAANEMGPNTVTIRVSGDNPDELNLGEDTLADIDAYINALRPVTTRLYVVSPIARPIDITLTGLDPNTYPIREAIIAELKDMFWRNAVPGAAVHVSHIREAISLAAGEHDHTLIAPIEDTVMYGEIPVLGRLVIS